MTSRRLQLLRDIGLVGERMDACARARKRSRSRELAWKRSLSKCASREWVQLSSVPGVSLDLCRISWPRHGSLRGCTREPVVSLQRHTVSHGIHLPIYLLSRDIPWNPPESGLSRSWINGTRILRNRRATKLQFEISEQRLRRRFPCQLASDWRDFVTRFGIHHRMETWIPKRFSFPRAFEGTVEICFPRDLPTAKFSGFFACELDSILRAKTRHAGSWKMRSISLHERKFRSIYCDVSRVNNRSNFFRRSWKFLNFLQFWDTLADRKP